MAYFHSATEMSAERKKLASIVFRFSSVHKIAVNSRLCHCP